jgi:type II secretory pathway pseudopilin PulG
MGSFQHSAKASVEITKMRKHNTERGFSLLELMIASILGLLVMGAMVSLFRTGMSTTFVVAQRAETQQNMRAAVDLMVKDINMAGAGITNGVQLPLFASNGTPPSLAKYGCDQTGTCYVPTHTYPTAPNNNYLYGIVPGFNNGVQGNAVINSAPGKVNDSITVVYADYNFPLSQYIITFPLNPDGTQVNVCANPNFNPAPPAINSAAGLKVGDLILLNGTNSKTAVGEITGLTATSISFANLDPLNMNFSGNNYTNNIYSISGGAGTTTPCSVAALQATAYRLFAVTYYLTVPNNGQLPRLMRQVNGLPPVPVADNIINLQFAYDVYDQSSTQLWANRPDPLGNGNSPNLIQKVNLSLLADSVTQGGNRSQNMSLATSVSARNMTFRNPYQ